MGLLQSELCSGLSYFFLPVWATELGLSLLLWEPFWGWLCMPLAFWQASSSSRRRLVLVQISFVAPCLPRILRFLGRAWPDGYSFLSQAVPNYVFNRTCGEMFRMNRLLSAAGRLTRRWAALEAFS